MKNYKQLYDEDVRPALMKKFKYKNISQVPKLEKIVVNRGLGEAITNSNITDLSFEQFKAITGQVPVFTKAKTSVSNFKLREGQINGIKVTLRGAKMYNFLSKLINVVLPAIRDFRGVPEKGFDRFGNYTLGLKEDGIFPEIQEADRNRGMDVTFVTTADDSEQAKELLTLFNMPFSKLARG